MEVVPFYTDRRTNRQTWQGNRRCRNCFWVREAEGRLYSE